jgi:tRNA-dihydrouridine synthase
LDDSSESRDNFYQIFDGAFQRGVAAITVHGRTVKQRYVGPSRWEFLREVKRHAGTRTVLGSGDLFTPAACLQMMAETGVDGVTAARGAIGNPWIFGHCRALAAGEAIRPPSLHEQRAILSEHFRLAESLYGPIHCGPTMRKFGIKYAQWHPQNLQVRDEFVRVKSIEEWRGVLDRWYDTDASGVWPTVEVDETVEC